MTQETLLFSQIYALPPHLQEEVSHFVQFLLQRKTTDPAPKRIIPKAGFGTVKMQMAADFDAPLEDFNEYME